MRITLAGIVLGAALLAGCNHGGGAAHPIVITNETPGILVQGHGEVETVPDVAVVLIGVEMQAASVGAARDGAAEAAQRVMEALTGAGVAPSDVQTTGLDISPQYEYPPNQSPLLIGYRVNNSVTVKIRRIDQASRIIDGAIRAGGNTVRLHGIHFEIGDPAKARAAAREKAVAEAKAKAEQLAELSGVSLGAPITVEEVAFSAPVVPYPKAMAEARDMATPISPGQTSVSVDVRVRWTIDG